MAEKEKLSLFGDSKLEVQLEKLDERLEELRQDAAAGSYDGLDTKLAKSYEIDVLGQPLGLDAKAEVKAHILAADAEVEVFQPGEKFSTPAGRPWAHFALDAGVNLETSKDLSYGQLAVALEAGAGAAFSYHHYLPAAPGANRLQALARVVEGSRLPAKLKIQDLERGEIHRWDRKFHFDFGLKVSYGFAFESSEVVDLFRSAEFPVRVDLDVEAALSASLGFGLFEAMSLTVAQLDERGWVRLRLERQRKSELTLGAKVAIQAKYDLGGSSLLKILDETLKTAPAQQVLEALADVRQYTGPAGEGDWGEIRGQLAATTQRTLRKLLDGVVDLDEVVGGPGVQRLLGWAHEIVETYQGLGETVRSWWSDLLDEARLGEDSKLRAELEKVVAFEMGDFVATRLEGLPIDLLEALSGASLDPMADIIELREAVGRAQTVAKEALSLLEKLDQVPDAFLDRFKSFAAETGIAKAVALISRFDTPAKLKAEIEKKVDQWIASLAERLLGKTWEKLDAGDLEKLQKWAKGVDAYLKRILALPDQLRAAVGRLKGELDVSLGLLYQRVTATSSLIDIVFDPNAKRLRPAIEMALEERDVTKVLALLPDPDAVQDQEPDYQILESFFTWRFTATGTLSLAFKFLSKLKKRTIIQQRSAAAMVRIEGGRRSATYVGGFERSVILDASSFQAASSLEVTARGSGLDLAAPYDLAVSSVLSLSVARTDNALAPHVVAGYQNLLRELQFAGADIGEVLQPRLGQQVRFSLRLILPQAAVEALETQLAKKNWIRLYHRAAARFFRDELTNNFKRGVPLGALLAEFVDRNEVKSFDFQHLFPVQAQPGQKLKPWMDSQPPIKYVKDGKTRSQRVNVFFSRVASVIDHRDHGFEAFGTLAPNVPLGHQAPAAPNDLRRLVLQAGRALKKASTGAWDSPMFDFWLLLALVDHHLDHEGLRGVRGLVQLRVRKDAAAEWETPQIEIQENGATKKVDAEWSLDENVPFRFWPVD